MKGKNDVYVFGDGSGFKVRPAVASAARKKLFWVRNCTNCAIDLIFPQGLLAAAAASWTIKKKKNRSFKFSTSADGVYEYEVHVTPAPGYTVSAVGESGPRIIVDP